MRIPLSFKGQSVFVAGGSSGINLGIATAFAQAGAHVAIASRNAERVAQAVEQLRQHGTQIEGVGRGGQLSGARFGDVGQRFQDGGGH
jgi:NAD(P)-dependent dehydrogenase (short-subunit alcohol dehydrogenase family)